MSPRIIAGMVKMMRVSPRELSSEFLGLFSLIGIEVTKVI